MKFKFNKNLDYQLDAINAVIDLFDSGKNIVNGQEEFELQSSPIIANKLEINKTRILKNLQNIQKQHAIEPVSQGIDSMDFSIEMETATGKTYVYLRTILELNQKYGLTKFIILVPSVAIREGVLKSIEQTEKHFEELYNTRFGKFAYDSKKLSRVREFAQSLGIQIMVMTVASFNKDNNIMRQTPDRFKGENPLSLVAQTNPVVIMDEPQNMESDLSKAAISDLNPLFKLRYSATHKEVYNLVSRLTPYEAYRRNLVKRIEVFGVNDQTANDFVFKIREFRIQKGKSPEAMVLLEVKQANDQFVGKEVLLKGGMDLYRKTGNPKYEGLMINEIHAGTKSIELSSGKIYKFEEQVVDNKEQIFRIQIAETIKAHLRKQEERGDEIKVLSIFIDKVDNYINKDGLIRKLFVEEFEKQKGNYDRFANVDVSKIHNGYFAKTKIKGQEVFKDTNGKSKLDKEAYDLIMKDKERLLSFDEPTCFIFSHSALREGWDNPNTFQICTLNETRGTSRKRQEIGRGLRLAVNKDGDRIHDSAINVLTVIANESYKEFVGRLQTEYTESGYKNAPLPSNARARVGITFKKHLATENAEFIDLWERIRKKTQYSLHLNEDDLVEKAVEKINELDVNSIVVRIEKVTVNFGEQNNITTTFENETFGQKLDRDISVGNFINRISKETGLTRNTILKILHSVTTIDLIAVNPEEYMRSVIVIIKGCMSDMVVNNGLMYTPNGDVWEIDLFENFESYSDRSIESTKSVYSRVVFDSEGERMFAESLERSPQVKLFTKLPQRFVVETPLGSYMPDWAIVVKTDKGDKLYLVRETKFGYKNLNQELSAVELMKILCGMKHCEAIDVDFKVSEKEDLNDLL